ncbi:hypothetical protein [Dyadobacter sediminis]|nr:hypothetical protein [Dyadobacter sediminis]
MSRSENGFVYMEAMLDDASFQSANAAAYFNLLLNYPLDTVLEVEITDQ